MNEKILFNEKEIILSLTGKESHKIIVEPGQGYLIIGTEDFVNKERDVLVEEKDIINWNALNDYYSLDGWSKKDIYPYGNWPSFLKY